MRYYDNTRVSTYRECPRKYALRHILNWTPDRVAIALVNGLAWHDAMDKVWPILNKGGTIEEAHKAGVAGYISSWVKSGMPEPSDMSLEQIELYSPRGPHKAAEILLNYCIARKPFIVDGELDSVEKPFAVPIYKDVKDVLYIGRLDKVFKSNTQGRLVIEHKSTTDYGKATGFKPRYIDSFSPNSQVDGYTHAAHVLYDAVKGVFVDAALFHKTVHDKFKFIPVDRAFNLLSQWLKETQMWIERINEDEERYKKHGLAGSFPKNTGACSNWAGCTYRDVCRYQDFPREDDVPAKFKVEEWNPFDVLKIKELGLEPEDKSL